MAVNWARGYARSAISTCPRRARPPGGTSTTAIIQDLSPEGVRRGLAALAAAREAGPPLEDPHDEAHLEAFEDHAQVVYGHLELHRSNPLLHLGEMDVACYDRDYAPESERNAARIAHLSQWPHAADHAIEALDRLSRPVANSLVGAVRGLSAGIPPGPSRPSGTRRWPRMRGSPATSSTRPPSAPRTWRWARRR